VPRFGTLQACPSCHSSASKRTVAARWASWQINGLAALRAPRATEALCGRLLVDAAPASRTPTFRTLAGFASCLCCPQCLSRFLDDATRPKWFVGKCFAPGLCTPACVVRGMASRGKSSRGVDDASSAEAGTESSWAAPGALFQDVSVTFSGATRCGGNRVCVAVGVKGNWVPVLVCVRRCTVVCFELFEKVADAPSVHPAAVLRAVSFKPRSPSRVVCSGGGAACWALRSFALHVCLWTT
jgi:hypothetical protein